MLWRQLFFFAALAFLIALFTGIASILSGVLTTIVIFFCLWWGYVFIQYWSLPRDSKDDDDDYNYYNKGH